MALARKKHRVTRLRQLDRSPDGGSPVDDDLEVTPRRLTGRAGLHVACDLHRVLAERIVGRDDEEVGELGRGTSHAGAVVVRARRRPEDDDQPAAGERPQLGQRAGQRPRRVREVDVDAKVLAEIDGFEPAAHALESGESTADVLDLHTQGKADPGGAERVVDVESRRDVQRDIGFPHRRLHAES